MSEIMVETVIGWFKEKEDELYDYDLGYLSVGDTIDFEHLPEGVVLKVVAQNTDMDYDSYGNASLDNGYIVFSVTTADGDSENFKLPMEYTSYEGWSFNVDRIVPTSKQAKVITTWEWV